MHRVVYLSNNPSIKYHEQKFYIKVAFSGQHWTGLSIEKIENSVFEVLLKISFSVLNQLRNQQFITCCCSLRFILLKITRVIPAMRNWHRNRHFTVTGVFPGLGPILTAGLKYWLTANFLLIFFLLTNCPMKVTVS